MPQKLFIPSINSEIILAEDWNFRLFFEGRNKGLIKALCPNKMPKERAPGEDDWTFRYRCRNWGMSLEDWEGTDLVHCEKRLTAAELKVATRTHQATRSRDNFFLRPTLPKGTVLAASRIYIRQGIEAFDSITWRTVACPDKKLVKKRFWVKLADANEIICEIIG